MTAMHPLDGLSSLVTSDARVRYYWTEISSRSSFRCPCPLPGPNDGIHGDWSHGTSLYTTQAIATDGQ